MAVPSPESLFRTLAEYTYDWETWVDPTGTPQWVNGAVERITGRSVAACLAMPDYPLPLAHPDDRGLLRRVLDAAARGESGNDVEFRVLRADGTERWVAISFQAVHGEDGASLGYRTSVRDIDERKRMEQELEQMRLRAEAAAVARAELLANVSHELRSPVHCIAGFSELLLSAELPSGPRRYAEIIQDQCRSMLSQVEDLLELAAFEAGGVRLVREPFELVSLVTGLVEGFTPLATQREITLTCDVPVAPVWVLGDAQRLGQVLRNLVDNALKFTERGDVRVSVSRDHAVHFVVADTGIGMDPREVERLLQPFQQGDASSARRHGGAGLGLSICRRLVDAMGGTLRVETERGRGTTVTVGVSLPSVDAPRPVALEPARRLSGHALVVDDSAAGRELLVEMLALSGFTALEADSGRRALERVREAPVDLVLLDYQMPDSDGVQVARALRGVLDRRPGPRVPIVLVTANVFVRRELEGKNGDIDAIVEKPLSRATLARLLTDVHGVSSLGTLDREVLHDLETTRGRDGRPLLARVLPRVSAEISESLATLRTGPARDVAQRAAHALAGQAAIVGARALADAARAFELDVIDPAFDYDARLSELERRAEEALSALGARLT